MFSSHTALVQTITVNLRYATSTEKNTFARGRRTKVRVGPFIKDFTDVMFTLKTEVNAELEKTVTASVFLYEEFPDDAHTVTINLTANLESLARAAQDRDLQYLMTILADEEAFKELREGVLTGSQDEKDFEMLCVFLTRCLEWKQQNSTK